MKVKKQNPCWAIALFLISTLFLANCSNNNQQSSEQISQGHIELVTDSKGLSKGKAIMKTVYGNVEIKFYPQYAPHTVNRIISLIQKGFYDGLSFHRVINNYLVQTGDPTGSGHGGSGQKLKAEFNALKHIRGSIGMARLAQDIDSADSQFYITLSTQPQLDGKYTIFGQVVEGLDLLDKIKVDDKIISLSLSNE